MLVRYIGKYIGVFAACVAWNCLATGVGMSDTLQFVGSIATALAYNIAIERW